MYDAKTFTMAEIAGSCGVTPMIIYRNNLVTYLPRRDRFDELERYPRVYRVV